MNDEKPQEVIVKVRIDQTDLDEMIRKIQHICELTREANSLAGELASKDMAIELQFES